MAKILIAGGTGLIGKRTTDLLLQQNHEVVHLSRSPKSNAMVPTFAWDISKDYVDPLALENVDYVINFAGTGIADKRWTASRKKDIIDSRVNGNLLFKKLIEEKKLNIKKFISSGAIGYYGDRGTQILTEDSPAGTEGFLVESCTKWEASAKANVATCKIWFRVLFWLRSSNIFLDSYRRCSPYFCLAYRYVILRGNI